MTAITRSSARPPRPRRFRTPGRRVRLTATDQMVLRYLVYLGFAPAEALYLFAWACRTPSSGTARRGLSGFARRLTELFHAGYVSRFDPRFSHYVRGGASFLYCVESGRAAEFARRGVQMRMLDPDDVDELRDAAAPTRAMLLELLVALGFAPEFAEARLDATARSACKFVSGLTSLVPHTLLAATWLSIVWVGLLSRGLEIAPIFPESTADLSFWLCGSGLCGAVAECRAAAKERSHHRASWIPIQPDCLFVSNGVAIALEAETGQASRAKVAEKVTRYTALAAQGLDHLAARLGVESLRAFHCVFHSATGTHAVRIADAIARSCPGGSDLFRITTSEDFALERTSAGRTLTRADFLTNVRLDGGVPLYEFFAARAFAPLFARVHGRASDGEADVSLGTIAW